MKIFVTADTHSPIDIDKLRKWTEGNSLTKSDYLIIAGDFGYFWNGSASEIFWRKELEESPWTTLFVDGNHENFDMLESYPTSEMFHGKVSVLSPSIIWLRRGEVYKIGGKKFFIFGGATSRDKDLRVPGRSWWPQEVPNMKEVHNAEKNLNRHNWEVDYVVTHTAPQLELINFLPSPWMRSYAVDSTTLMLQEFKNKLKFKHWYFGHIHRDLTRENFTTLYHKIIEIKENWK